METHIAAAISSEFSVAAKSSTPLPDNHTKPNADHGKQESNRTGSLCRQHQKRNEQITLRNRFCCSLAKLLLIETLHVSFCHCSHAICEHFEPKPRPKQKEMMVEMLKSSVICSNERELQDCKRFSACNDVHYNSQSRMPDRCVRL